MTVAVGYARLSEARETSTSIARQTEAIRQEAERRGWTLEHVYVDDDVSATRYRLNRPGLQALRERVARGGVDVVAFWRVDRLARSVADLSHLTEEFTKHGAAPVSVTEPFDATSPMGTAMMTLLGVFAQLEASATGARVASSRAKLREERRFPGGRVPYGYRIVDNPNGAGKVLEPDPEQAATIRWCATQILDEGRTAAWCCRRLNERGVPTPSPGKVAGWWPLSLKKILTGNAILGRQTHNGDVVRDEAGVPVEFWEPILSVADVEALRAALAPKRPGATQPKRYRREYLLSGLLVCEACGYTMRHRSRGERARQYTCPHWHEPAKPCPAPQVIDAANLEAYVVDQFLTAYGWMPEQHPVIRRQEREGRARVEEAIRDTLAALGTADDPEVEAELMSRLQRLKAERAELAKVPDRDVVEMVSTGATVRDAWEAADVDKRRDMLASALAGPITVRRGVPGRRGMDTDRVTVPWKADVGR